MTEKNKRKEHQKNTRVVNAKGILVIALVCVLIVTVAVLLVAMGKNSGGSTAPVKEEDENIVETTAQFGQTQSGSSHRGFPISFSGNGILDVKSIGSGLYVLTKDTLTFVSTSGAYRTPLVLNYVEPVLKTGGRYALLFDRLSGKYMLANERRQLLQGQSENGGQINTAAVTDDGHFLIAAKGGSYSSLLTYYNKKGKILFSWECAKEHIVAVDISDNGKNLLCAALGARNGEIFTKLYLLNIKKNDTVWETTLSGTAAIECFFAGGKNVIAVCNDRRVLLHTKQENAEPNVYTYPSSVLLTDSDRAGNTAIVTQQFGSFDTYEILILNRSNEVKTTALTEQKVIGVVCDGRKATLLTDAALLNIRASGKLSEIAELSDVHLGLAVVGKSAYHYSKNALYKN